MLQHHPVVQGLSRLGAIAFLVVFLFDAFVPSLSAGRRIGLFFSESLGETFLGGAFFDTLLVGIGAFLLGLAALMFYVVVGALLGSAAGSIIVRYVVEPRRPRE